MFGLLSGLWGKVIAVVVAVVLVVTALLWPKALNMVHLKV